MEVDIAIDTKGMKCPLPVLKAKMALKTMSPGQLLSVTATDTGSVADFKSFCETTGNDLISSKSADGVYNYLIRKQ